MNVFRSSAAWRVGLVTGTMAVLAALSAAAAADAPKASKELLTGSWSGVVEVNDEQLQADEKFKEVPPEQAQLVLKIVKDQFSQMKMNISFGADGQVNAEFDGPDVPEKDKKQTGTWEVVKADGPNITVRITSAKDEEEDEEDEDEGDDEESEEEEGEEEDKDAAKQDVDEVTFRFDTETSMVGADMGDKLPKGVLFKFTKQ